MPHFDSGQFVGYAKSENFIGMSKNVMTVFQPMQMVCRVVLGALFTAWFAVVEADTLLKVELEACQRQNAGRVICPFSISGDVDDTLWLTGGQYTQGLDTASW